SFGHLFKQHDFAKSKANAFLSRMNQSAPGQSPLSEGRTQSLCSGPSGRMPGELCWATDGPSQRAHGTMME
ncbi:MAG: hypothetical protein K2X80_05340, partial [Pseudomonadaceae bacterium]|nr:hypothetical protein [Pseudomonadaceae bacterium]